MPKIKRNELCPCGSGQMYKYCCISKNLKKRNIAIPKKCRHCSGDLNIDMTDDFMNRIAALQMPLKMFCKDNGFYMFGLLTGEFDLQFIEKLQNRTLKKEDFFDAYKKLLTPEIAHKLLNDACNSYSEFGCRKEILMDACNSHFGSKYTLSVPVFFLLIEGILRDIGGLELKDTFRPTLHKEIWDKRLFFPVSDNVEFFNAYITKLFEGSPNTVDFNRNNILHGMNTSYSDENNSIMLFLTLIEIYFFKRYETITDEMLRSKA